MYAVIKVGGKQYRVSEGDEIFVEKLNANTDDVITFDQVLMLDSKVGSPYLSNVTVEGTVLKNGKAKKYVFLSTKTNLEATVKLRDIDNHILKLKLLKLMVNYD